jgi:hypothetical protein
MSEMEKEKEEQIPTTTPSARFAMIFPVSVSIIGFIGGFWTEIFPSHDSKFISIIQGLCWMLIWSAPCIGLVLAITVEREINKSHGETKGRIFAVIGFVIPLLLSMIAFSH